MNEKSLEAMVPRLTEILELGEAVGADPSDAPGRAAVLAALPALVQEVVEDLRPQVEQLLLDALLPRVAAMLQADPARTEN